MLISSGDAVQRETSAITYTVSKLTNVVGDVNYANLSGTDAEMFDIGPVEKNAKGQPTVKLTLKPYEDYSTAKSYKIKLNFILDNGIEVSSSDLTVKVSNTAIKLKAPAAQTIFQSQSRSRTLVCKVELTSPVDAAIGEVEIGSVGLLQRSLVNDANVWVGYPSDDGKYVNVYVTIKDTSALNAGKSYTLPLLIKAEGCATNIAATKLNLSLKVLK